MSLTWTWTTRTTANVTLYTVYNENLTNITLLKLTLWAELTWPNNNIYNNNKTHTPAHTKAIYMHWFEVISFICLIFSVVLISCCSYKYCSNIVVLSICDNTSSQHQFLRYHSWNWNCLQWNFFLFYRVSCQ